MASATRATRRSTRTRLIVSQSIAEQKSALRRRIQRNLKQLSLAERSAASIQVCARLQRQIVWRDARSVLLYSALPDELDVGQLLHAALAADKIVALPRFDSRQETYLAGRVLDLTADLRPGQFGIVEPNEHCPIVPLNRLDFVLVPGVAFGLNGGRVGRGKGFYDRLLVSVRGIKCGVAFDLQIVDQIPAEPHDVRLNWILTPTRWWPVDPGAV
jgi:5-formyltetrahydrofolate cyclo-ligase